jgi:hypothetical protein
MRRNAAPTPPRPLAPRAGWYCRPLSVKRRLLCTTLCAGLSVIAVHPPAVAQSPDPVGEPADSFFEDEEEDESPARGEEDEAKRGAGDATASPPVVGERLPYYPVNVSLIYPLAINAAHPTSYTHVDLALILSSVGVVYGLQLGTLGWIVHDLRGVQLDVAGVVGGKAEGLMVGGVFAMANGSVEGMQVAGALGWADEVRGLQVAGIGAHTARDLDGVQASGVFNVLRKDLEGIQLAGAVNIGRVDGFQLAPINVSQRARGLQIGILNVAREIDGLQIGVVNVTDNLDGESLGIIPLPRRGGIHLSLWGSNSLLGNVGIKFASRYAYSILSTGIGNEDDDQGGNETIYAAGLTMGAALPIADELRVSSDLGVYRRFRDELTLAGRDEIYKLRFAGAYSIARRMSPFVGAGAFLSLRDGANQTTDGEIGPEIFLGVEL